MADSNRPDDLGACAAAVAGAVAGIVALDSEAAAARAGELAAVAAAAFRRKTIELQSEGAKDGR